MPDDFGRFLASAAERERDRQFIRNGPDLEISIARRHALEGADVLVVTCAQNDAPLARTFHAALSRYLDARGAELAVLPIRYRNPTSPFEAEKTRWVWPAEIQPSLVGSRLERSNLIVFGDLRLQATAQDPLVGLEPMSRGLNAVVGHAQFAMETVPAPGRRLPAILHTTGSISRPRYSQTKAGARGHFHHTVGALVIERGTAGRVHMRRISADHTGGFFDLGWYFSPTGKPRRERPRALVTGDTHVDVIDAIAARSTYGKGGLVDEIRPEMLVWHDVLDFSSRSHHDDAITQIAKVRAGRADVRGELARATEFLRSRTPRGCESVIVASNHHEHLRKWVLCSDWRTEGANAAVLLELAQAMVEGARLTRAGVEQIDPFAWWARTHGGLDQMRFLRRGESLILGGVEVTAHGDIGPRGARGTRRNLDRGGVRRVIGHGHGPGVFRGVDQVGTTSRRDLIYTRGSPSDWLCTHCIIGQNGKKQLVTVQGDEYKRAA